MRVARRPAAIGGVLAALLVAWAGAARAAETRHPEPGTIPTPAGVPASYVLTHNGWFHPSCVVRVRSDETVGADLVVRGRDDGAPHFAFGPCGYQRFDLRGGAAAGGAAPAHAPPAAAAAVYDGYIVYYQYSGAITAGSTLVTDEIVPPPPTNVANQDIAFFNDILTTAGGGDILQPVLDFNGETRGKWSIESEHCCIANNDMQTTPVVVAPGDQIRGTVTGTSCGSNGVCSAWAVTTLDVTSGKSTTLNTTAPNGVPNGVSPGSLETYGVMSCDMFPVGGETTFTNNTLTDPAGNVQTLKYGLLTLDQVNAEVPTNCGYAGKSSGNDFTLIYGPITSGSDGGTTTGAGGASTGGQAGAGGRGEAGAGGRGGAAGRAGAGGAGGAGGHAGAPGGGGAPGTGGSSGKGGTGAAGASGSGGLPGGATGGGGSAGDGGSSSGCSCDAGGNPTPGFTLVFAFVAATLWARGRRRS
jgi:hypothetical protein